MRTFILVGATWLGAVPTLAHAQYVGDQPEANDGFGGAVATGDFDGDGFDDLAVSTSGEDVDPTLENVGVVHVVHGGPGSLSDTRLQEWTQDSAKVEDNNEGSDYFGEALAAGDFDGDGADDLVIGVPFETVAGFDEAGAVNVLYGTVGVGLTAAGDQFWTQDTPGIDGSAGALDRFGGALAVGDFDGDGFADLAVSAYQELVDLAVQAGSVHVIYGSRNGLTAQGDHVVHQNAGRVEDEAEAVDEYGSALAVGDFDDDGFDDLAVGIPLEDFGAAHDAGAVNVLFGSADGLTVEADQLWAQSAGAVADAPEDFDQFGRALAAGDFDGDGTDDLAIGVPGEDGLGLLAMGVVQILFGEAGVGLTDVDNQVFLSGHDGLKGAPEQYEQFGAALAAADFDADGVCDLATGQYTDIVAPGHALATDSGTVRVLLGMAGVGLTGSGDQLFSRATRGVSGVPRAKSYFGNELATGDFDGDGLSDLVIGAIWDDADGHNGAGSLHVLHGTATGGLTPIGDQIWTQGP